MIWAEEKVINLLQGINTYAETNYAKPMMVAESKAIYET